MFGGTQLGSLVNSLEMVIKAMAVDEILGSQAMEKKGGQDQDCNNATILETFYFAILTDSAEIVQRGPTYPVSMQPFLKEDSAKWSKVVLLNVVQRG